jgi:flavin reductase (DIM6/NTAB) family NADH-FMN oxidoreductase RutF
VDTTHASSEDCRIELFRDAMARVCTPVSVVTTFDGQPHGSTVSAFSSLSLDPELILIALDRASDLLTKVVRTRRLGLNVLNADQVDLAKRFARKGLDDFAGVAWRSEHDVPRLMDATAWLACAVDDIFEGGDHRIVVGRVRAVRVRDAEPLTYHARTFGTHARTAELGG